MPFYTLEQFLERINFIKLTSLKNIEINVIYLLPKITLKKRFRRISRNSLIHCGHRQNNSWQCFCLRSVFMCLVVIINKTRGLRNLIFCNVRSHWNWNCLRNFFTRTDFIGIVLVKIKNLVCVHYFLPSKEEYIKFTK